MNLDPAPKPTAPLDDKRKSRDASSAEGLGSVVNVGRRSNLRRAQRRARETPERRQDPRLVATQVPVGAEITGPLDIKPGDWMVAVSPVRLPDGRVLAYHPPQP